MPKAQASTASELGQFPDSWEALTLDHKAALNVFNRFRGKRPENLAEQLKDSSVRAAVERLFDRLEGKLDAEKIARLKEAFERGVNIWAQAGLFSAKRESIGFVKPDFERDYEPHLTQYILDMTEAGTELNRGYGTPVFAPKDVPLYSKSAETLSYFELLKEALIKAFHSTAGGKQPKTLLIGPEKRVLTADQVDLEEILYRWERYLKDGVVHNVKELDVKKHGGISEEQALAQLTDNEKKTGGVMRLERNQLIMPADVGEEEMSALDWQAKLPKVLPGNAEAQDIKEAIAHAIYCLETEGWMPDYFDWQSPKASRVNLALKSFVPDEGSAGAVPALFWNVRKRLSYVDGYDAGYRYSDGGVRGGVRIFGS